MRILKTMVGEVANKDIMNKLQKIQEQKQAERMGYGPCGVCHS